MNLDRAASILVEGSTTALRSRVDGPGAEVEACNGDENETSWVLCAGVSLPVRDVVLPALAFLLLRVFAVMLCDRFS